MENLLFEVTATDPLTYAGVSAVLALVVFLANLIRRFGRRGSIR